MTYTGIFWSRNFSLHIFHPKIHCESQTLNNYYKVSDLNNVIRILKFNLTTKPFCKQTFVMMYQNTVPVVPCQSSKKSGVRLESGQIGLRSDRNPIGLEYSADWN